MSRRYYSVLLLTTLLFLIGCSKKASHLFTPLEESTTGIHFKNTLFEDGPLNVSNYIYFYNGGGVAIGDINNDGLQDILFTGNMVRNRLYINKGNFQFEDITAKSGVAEKQGWCTGATMVDINGDGRLDIYICRSADINPQMRKNLLFINNGDLTFTEKAASYGLDDVGYSTQAAFFDYDKDGDLDCFIINHSLQKYTAGIQDKPELRKEHNPDFASKLYRNDNGHYSDVSQEAGITSNVFTFGLGLAVSDFNNDGWPDVYTSNDFNEPDYLFINNRNGTFTEQLRQCMDETSLYSMGADAADYNNDGQVDLVTLDMLPEDNKTQKMHSGAENFDKFQYLFNQGFYYQYSRNMLQKNNGDGTFSEVGQLAGVSNTDWSWAALFGDYDNDGNKDLFITNGYVKDYTDMDFLKYSVDRVIHTMNKEKVDAIPAYIQKMPTNKIANYIFQNNGNETFTKRTADWGLDQPGVSAGAAYADLDNDGDLDLVVNNSNEVASIYKNNEETVAKNNFLRIRLQGSKENERGIGTKVKVYANGSQYYAEQSPVRGFQSSSDPVLTIGMGKHTRIDSIWVIWPNDASQKLTNIKPGQTLTVNMAAAKNKWAYDTLASTATALFTQAALSQVQHQENQYNDFTIQSLMPNYLSRQGPCLEVADVNKDGLQDFYMGGAKGQAGQLFLQTKNGTFISKPETDFVKDAGSEDVAAAFFDCDGDGDSDLYVASGGYEFRDNDPVLADRLYLNDGKGNFSKNSSALPAIYTSKGCVKPADIDGDGDIDLFIGGRVVPGRYPTSPHSYILLNDGKGNYTDATAAVCPFLQQIGMVTDAVWMDINNDHQPDLVVVGEWMPVKVMINQQGKLSDQSATYIHFGSTGWWNRVAAADMDDDGDMDLILGNCGLNTQFHASQEAPMTLYYKDFNEDGYIDPILCYYIDGLSYPAASLDDLTKQLPHLKKKFLEYKDYASATIQDIFTPDELQDAGHLQAEMMQSVYLENKGAQGFMMHNLPLQAQYAPVYGIAATDVNKDGKKDLVLAGNNSWTRIKFGRYTANHGIVLLGDRKGNFTYMPQQQSGLNIRGDVKSLSLLTIQGKPGIIAGLNDNNAVQLTLNH